MREIAFDCETYPLAFVPDHDPKACRNQVPKLVCTTFHGDGLDETVLERPDRAVDRWLDLVRDDQTKLIGHNVAFDMAVMARAAVDVGAHDDPIPLLLDKYENPGELSGGKVHDTRLRQMLIDLATKGTMYRRHLDQIADLHLDETKHEGGDRWRVRYNELAPYPTSDWPEDAVAYAKLDAELTFRVYQTQKKRQRSALGTVVADEHGVVNEPFQVRSAFALQLMSAWGLQVDVEQTQRARERYEQRRDELRGGLEAVGMIDSTGSKNMSEIRRRYAKAFNEASVEPERTDTGKISTSKDARAKLKRYGELPGILAKFVEWDRITDYLSTYFRPLEQAPPFALCPSFNPLVKSGRTSSSKPNLQNFPKRAKPNQTIDPKSVRRCFQPRDGWKFVCGDWSRAELRCLAQVNINWGHEPCRMAEAVRSGRDLHTDLAADIEGIAYEEAVRGIGEGDPDVKKARDVAKVGNFGYPGGMGPKSLPSYAKGFGVDLTVPEAEELSEDWHDRWSEMSRYFDRIEAHKRGGSYPIMQHGPFGDDRKWRVRNAHGFPKAANTMFQGMAGDGKKASLWLLVRECYADTSSPLYGCRPCVDVHDEFLIEAPEDRALQAGEQLRDVMIEGMEMFTPDVPAGVDVEVGDRWGEGVEL